MKHKHYDLIVAWAEGKVIQAKYNQTWIDQRTPQWDENYIKYRIKPEPIPDVIQEMHMTRFKATMMYADPNLRLTFDGETGDLKKAEVI
jgi:hypothetical protein